MVPPPHAHRLTDPTRSRQEPHPSQPPSVDSQPSVMTSSSLASSPDSARTARPAAARALLLLPAGLCLLAGLDAALARIGVAAPVTSTRVADAHGALMVFGFLGGLIALERAVATRRGWALVAPAFLAGGGVTLLLPTTMLAGQLLVIDGCLALIAVYVVLWRRQRDTATAVQALGAVMLLCAAVLWVRFDLSSLTPWLVGFVVTTIAAERYELARLTLPHRAGATLLGLSGVLLAGAAASVMWPDLGARVLAAGLIALASWLARHDVARRTVHSTGLPRFSAAAVLAGYAWLAAAGVAGLVAGSPGGQAGTAPQRAGDLVVHAVFLGFAMSMVLAHAPVILPAVVRRPLPYRPIMWVPLAVLHVGLVARLGLGDVLGVAHAWTAGAVLTVVALPLLVATALTVAIRAGRSQ